MARMKAVMAAALVMEREGISQAFGVPRKVESVGRQGDVAECGF